ncbi:MAG: lactonase family protein [Chitinophagales bacterium]
MKKINVFLSGMTALMTFAFVSCSKEPAKTVAKRDQQTETTASMISENGANPDETVMSTSTEGITGLTATNSVEENRTRRGHYLYSESNESGVNQIYVYGIGHDGSLSLQGSTASGGIGTGAGLGSQGALVLSEDHEWLFAVNAGSNSVSSFKVHDDGSLTLAHTENSKGKMPVSVSVHRNLLYVLNFGSDNIHGFRVGEKGMLTHIEGSTKPLSGTGVVPPQISFTPNGNWLMVTEKATNVISSFKVKNDGSVWPDVVTASTGQTPFGFNFGRDDFMIVSNAAGGAAGAGSATSYRIGGNGVPHEINGAIPNDQGAPCWVATTKYGRFAFVSNTGSNTISSYYVAPEGYLYLVSKAAVTTDNSPADIVVASNNYNVYGLNVKSGTIGEYHRKFLGGLELIGSVSGLPAAVTGLATY